MFDESYPRLKMIVNDINECWSQDLAYDKLFAKHNRGVQFLLVSVNCLSRNLPLKTRYGKETAEAKQTDQNKLLTDKGMEFEGEFKKLGGKQREIIKYNTQSKRNSIRRTELSNAQKYSVEVGV